MTRIARWLVPDQALRLPAWRQRAAVTTWQAAHDLASARAMTLDEARTAMQRLSVTR